ncbi:diacylglycerol/polyprenol kinase family protein [Caldimicrobium thiodismutans]|uniref:hypothetical protein n=1 Tax=Caldimicrobium thiodismutans TaxID=1653476 RepID=UPI000838E0C2|nr:hypothetical protein [Caldimicrobium thiodismutans]
MGINWRRRLFHIIASLFFFALSKLLNKTSFQIFLFFSGGLLFLWETLRLKFPERVPFKGLWIGLLKEREKRELSDASFFILGIFISSLLVSEVYLGVCILILGISDPLAGIAGSYCPKGPFIKGKTLVGSLVFFFSSLGITLYFLEFPLITLLGLVLFLSLIELFTKRDNFWIPVAYSIYLRLFLTR